MNDPRYPIGTIELTGTLTPAARSNAIGRLGAVPNELHEAVRDLDVTQLDTPYRDGGWTVRQVVHHVPESHMNAYIRFKLALTEDNPTIKPYDEDAWSNLADVPRVPIETSLALLEALHERWVTLLNLLKAPDFERPLVHPENGPMPLDRLLQVYAWHGRHHVAHITTLRTREGW